MEVHDLGEFAAKDWPAPEKGFAKMIQNIDRDTGRISICSVQNRRQHVGDIYPG